MGDPKLLRRRGQMKLAQMKKYVVNEIFYSIQGEGMRTGTANVFVRFTGCNMKCSVEPGPKSPGGFDCDTEFESGAKMTTDEINERAVAASLGMSKCQWMILTGGEPALQVDVPFCLAMHAHGWKLAIETNGSKQIAAPIEWVTVSPKVAEHAIRQTKADEVKYVRGYGQGIPKTAVRADNYLISPAFNGIEVDREALMWCIRLVKENPIWRLSPQLHKGWNVR